LFSEMAKLSQEEYQPKSELGRKLKELEQYSNTELTADNYVDVEIGLLPIEKSFGEKVAENFDKKENRMRELENLRESLGRKSEYATYAAISLQLFGLMLVLAKDLFKHKKPKEQKGDST
jgi:hypothetical protein